MCSNASNSSVTFVTSSFQMACWYAIGHNPVGEKVFIDIATKVWDDEPFFCLISIVC